jgi:hypothetical protein
VEIIFELLFEFIGQLIIEVLFEAGLRGIARLLSNRTARIALAIALALTAGYGGGYWWGYRLSELGRTDPPKSLWLSIGLAAAFFALALARSLRGSSVRQVTPSEAGPRGLWPWHWSSSRLFGFALLNAAVAVGIAVGFTPRALR